MEESENYEEELGNYLVGKVLHQRSVNTAASSNTLKGYFSE